MGGKILGTARVAGGGGGFFGGGAAAVAGQVPDFKVWDPVAAVAVRHTLTRSLHLFEPRHFLFPFLAHALGTLVGAAVTALLAASRKVVLALAIGVVFLAGGVANTFMLPGPMWFNVLDMVGAYLPMAWIGGRLAVGRTVARG
jgi:hypothetical protein